MPLSVPPFDPNAETQAAIAESYANQVTPVASVATRFEARDEAPTL